MWLSPRLMPGDDVLGHVDEQHGLAGLREQARERHADVAGADDGDVPVTGRGLGWLRFQTGLGHWAKSVQRASAIFGAALPSPYSSGRSAGQRPRGCDGGDEPLGIVVHEDVRSLLDGVHPLGRRPRGHAGDAVPVRLFLQPARVGDDDAGL